LYLKANQLVEKQDDLLSMVLILRSWVKSGFEIAAAIKTDEFVRQPFGSLVVSFAPPE
jgi:hypothetical protein